MYDRNPEVIRLTSDTPFHQGVSIMESRGDTWIHSIARSAPC